MIKGETMRKIKMLEKGKIALAVIILLGLVSAGAQAQDYGAKVGVTNTPPFIDSSSFTIKIASAKELYPVGDRRDAAIPYAFSGETLTLQLNVSDDNGDQGILSANAVLSDDNVIDHSDIIVELAAVESTRDGDLWLTFTKDWDIPSSPNGLKKILIAAGDAAGLEASNNGVLVGQVFLNPRVVCEVSAADSPLASLSFESAPGTENVYAKENPITVRNMDPDGVGMKVRVSVKGTDLANGDRTGVIPVSNMKVNGNSLTTAPQLMLVIASGASNTLEFTLDYPLPLPAGDYNGSITIILEVV